MSRDAWRRSHGFVYSKQAAITALSLSAIALHLALRFGFDTRALAFGLPIITTEWRTIPELPGDLAIFVRPQEPLEIAAALLRLATREQPDFAGMRARFLAHFVASRHVEALRHALDRAA